LIAGEPRSPSVKTSIPGPRTQALLKELNEIQVCIQCVYKVLSIPHIGLHTVLYNE
jgi:hypothetical protein